MSVAEVRVHVYVYLLYTLISHTYIHTYIHLLFKNHIYVIHTHIHTYIHLGQSSMINVCYPAVIITGLPKCGTSAMYDLLSRFPGMVPSVSLIVIHFTYIHTYRGCANA